MSMNEIDNEAVAQKVYISNKTNSKYRKLIKENYNYFGLLSLIYAFFYTFCEYKNDAGITILLLVIGTICYYVLVFKRLEKKIKNGSLFYLTSIILIGLSIPLTDNVAINMMSKLALMILFVLFNLHQFYDDAKWNILKYAEAFAILGIETIAAVIYPFTDAINAMKETQKKKDSRIKYVFIGILTAIPLSFVIMSLLVSADLIFADMFKNLMNKMLLFKDLFWILIMIVFCYITIYCFINAIGKNNIKEELKDSKILDPIISITFTAIISSIYIMFCFVQIIGLFGANLRLPQGYTYSQYAREGFFQLLFVCGLNLMIVLCCMALFRESKILKILLTFISVCTYIMLASSAYRMILYIQVYQLTFLRVFVLWSIVVIAFLMIGIMIHIYKMTFPLFRYCMIVVTACYIVIAFSRPDYFIARYNIEAMSELDKNEEGISPYEQYGDLYYITSLSADAAKALEHYEKDDEIVSNYFEQMSEKSKSMSIRTFNFSRYIAEKTAQNFFD